jgi:hypothetical protein
MKTSNNTLGVHVINNSNHGWKAVMVTRNKVKVVGTSALKKNAAAVGRMAASKNGTKLFIYTKRGVLQSQKTF